MAVTINGDGTIGGISVGGLPDGVVDSGTLATGIDATKLADGTITNSELQYINSLSSNAQTQISAAGGAWTVISSQTASASADISFTSIGSYESYCLIYSDTYPAITSVHLVFRVSHSGTFQTGGYHTATDATSSSGGIVAGSGWSSGIGMNPISQVIVNTANIGQAGVLFLHNVANGSYFHMSGHGMGYTTGPVYTRWTIGGSHGSATNVDGFRLYYNAGNIATGTFTLYGISNA